MKGTKYLSELVDCSALQKEKLNVIKAPTGSGKTYFALQHIPSLTEDAIHEVVYLIDTINGKEQIVRKELLDRHPQEGYLTTVQAKSIDKAIRRYMADTRDEKGQLLSEKYPRETAHTIRKLYATERMQEERGSEPLPDKKEEMKCWDRVSHELGHGDGREALYKVYCKG